MRPLIVTVLLIFSSAFAAVPLTLGSALGHMALSFEPIGRMILGLCTLAGAGFGVVFFFKLKQNRDNPQQHTLGTALMMMALSAALIYLPGFYSPIGRSIFGSQADLNQLAGSWRGHSNFSYDVKPRFF